MYTLSSDTAVGASLKIFAKVDALVAQGNTVVVLDRGQTSVTTISADITQDQKTSASYYLVRISMSAAEIARLNDLKLVAGMPVEAFIQTGDRTVMSYLVKPLHDQIVKAFRER